MALNLLSFLLQQSKVYAHMHVASKDHSFDRSGLRYLLLLHLSLYRTLLEQSAVIRVIGIPLLQGTLEDMTVRNFDSNSTNGRQAIIDIIETLNK